MPISWSAGGERLAKHGPLLASLLAAVAAVPGLFLPFLADDWILLGDAARGILSRTLFGYFRPLTVLTYRMEMLVWGARPLPFHLLNLALASGAAGLLVVVVRRLTSDARLAMLAGILFALHPYHAESCWWIAGRADLLAFVLLLAALLAYGRWRAAARGWPVLAMLLFEAALLSKEVAVSFPAFLLLVRAADRNDRPGRRELVRGLLPMLAVVATHFLLRGAFLGRGSFAPLAGTTRHGATNFCSFVAGSVIPLHTELLEGRPFFWGAIALAPILAALFFIFWSSRPIPSRFIAASAAFLILLAPSLLSFQERYLYLPSAASAVALASLAGAMPVAGRRISMAALILLWVGSLAWHGEAWNEAGQASRRLIGDLKSASLRPGVEEMVVINMPYRVHGVALAANFQEAMALSGGRRLPIRVITALDFPSAEDDGLQGGLESAIRKTPEGIEIRLNVPEVRFSRIALPPRDELQGQEIDGWSVAREDARHLVVRSTAFFPRKQSLYVWSAGRLRSLQP